jgi:hypothetical protein
MQVTPDSDLFAELRMRRMGAISGRVLDENGVGLPGVTVLAYRARLPLRSVASGKSDDRGVYRIAGLDPGKYWIRTAAAQLDDGSGILPTFGPLSRETRDARIQTVNLDGEAQDANVQPEPGSLFRLTGKVLCDRPDTTPVNVTLSSETGKRSTRAMCGPNPYVFEGLAPDPYEILAAYDDLGGFGFVELTLDHDSDLGNVQLMKAPTVDFEFRNAADRSLTNSLTTVFGRRDDLSGSDLPVKIATPRTILAPGHWEMNALPDPNQYVQSITGFRSIGRPWRAERPSEWHDVFVDQRASARIQVLISSQAGRISGTVKAAGASIPATPVFLWPVAEAARRSLGGTHQMLADTEGHYEFTGLPPGDYRILATFDYTQPELEVFEEAHAPSITVTSAQSAVVDVPLWVAP